MQAKGWTVFSVSGRGPDAALNEFSNKLVDNAARVQLLKGAQGMLAGVPDDRLVTIITSGHRRDDCTGYFALSVSISMPALLPMRHANEADTNEG